jgi:hypothetical protein
MSNTAKLRRIYATTLLAVLPIFPACQQTKVVLVPSGDPVMLAKPTKASVYGFDKDQKLVGPSTVTLPAGWYALPKTK